MRISQLLDEAEDRVSEATGVATAGLEQVAAELRSRDRFLLTAHEGPDGDALGSLLGMHHLLTQLGKDSVMFLAAKEFPLPIEYRFLPLEEVFHEPPADMADRTVVFLDCGNIDRMPVDFLTRRRQLRASTSTTTTTTPASATSTWSTSTPPARPRSSTTWRRCSGAEITPEIASALYVGLITDTGKFMYENTDARTHRIAAELIDAGVDVDDTYRRLYEHVPIEKLRLVARALEGIERHCDGRARRHLHHRRRLRGDRRRRGDDRGRSSTTCARSRAPRSPRVVRDLGDRGRAARKVSLRSSDGEVDVSAIARKHGGGGHKRAAGFSTDLELDELVELPLRRGRRAARPLSMARDGDGAVLLCDKPAGVTSHDVVAAVRRERGLQGRPRRHARPVRHRPAAGPARPGDAPAALPARPAEDLPGDRAARLALQHRRPRRRADRDRAHARTRWSCRPARCASGCR